VRPISWVLAPTWGMNAIREAAAGGAPLDDLLMCLGLGALYVGLGIFLTERILRSARVNAALQLS
jgi:ABC-2 type transport system permease protein